MAPGSPKITIPKVTIIIPTYNWSAVLPFSIGSALDQSFADFELIVVGDGCTDDSAEVVAAIGDPRVRWINLPANSGHQSAPNNEGLRQARGELIAYLGHDDLWLPHHLRCLVDAIDAGADMAFGLTRFVAPEPEREPRILGGGPYQPGGWVPPTSVVHRKSLVERCGGWRDHRELAGDPESDLWTRFHAAGARIQAVPRLTAVKFPAALRRGVYRERPSHEQAAWLARIRAEPDFEPAELARLLLAATRRPFGALLGELLRRVGMRARRSWRKKRSPKPGERIEQNRRDKGLVPAGAAPGGME